MTIVLTPVEENMGSIKDTDLGLRSLETTAAEDLLRGLSK